MHVYRISLKIHTNALVASGFPARWNPKNIKVIYSASSRALACLENIVHRNAIGLQSNFRTIVIDVPDNIAIKRIQITDLPESWTSPAQQDITRDIGASWVSEGKTAVLQVPSVIIAEESNFLFNLAHADFKKIRIISVEPFNFDPRLKN